MRRAPSEPRARSRAAQLKEVEDREIERVIKKQEEVGLKAITDGEFRRSWWHLDFLWGLDGAEKHVMDTGIKFAAVNTRNEGVRGDRQARHVRAACRWSSISSFVAAHTRQTPKITIPSPSAIYGRPVATPIDKKAYPDMEAFWTDLGNAYKKAVRGFADAGCRYLQLDEVFIAMLCDPKYRDQMVKRGDDPQKLGPLYGDLINAAMSDIPADMTITMHLCRGNYKSTFMGSGGYDDEAEVLFNRIKVHGYFMEYDTERSGGFEPLRLVPKDRRVVLGLVTTKTGELESKDLIKRRIDEAAKYVEPRSALPVAAMRLRLDRGRQHADRGTAMGEAADDRGSRRGSVGEQVSSNNTAPFRADHVGSILRTAPLKKARIQREKGEIDAAALKAVEDEEIRKIIKKQEEVGLKLATDGEFRRSWWQFDFFKLLDGAELYRTAHGIKFAGVETRPEDIRVTGKIGYSGAPMIDHFRVPEGEYQGHAEDDAAVADRAALSRRPKGGGGRHLQVDRGDAARSRARLSQGDQGVRRCRLPLSATRRHLLRASVRSGAPPDGEGSRRGPCDISPMPGPTCSIPRSPTSRPTW